MTFTPEQTQKIVVSSGNLVKLAMIGFSVCVALIGYIGKSVIERVDGLAVSFNAYVVTMERRVTALEENQKELLRREK